MSNRDNEARGDYPIARIPLPKIPRAIVFDFDGTLYSQGRLRRRMSLELLTAALRSWDFRVLRVLKAYREAHEVVRWQKLPVNAGRTQLALAAEGSGLPLDTVQEIVAEWFETAPLKHLQLCMREEFPLVAASAKSKGIKLGVVSDYPARRKLEATGLTSVFDSVVSSFDEDVDSLKPEPKGLLRCLQQLGVVAAESIYVGDRPEVDAHCATLAGASSIIVGKQGFLDTELASILNIGPSDKLRT